jgi:eukaryotic-like serine/threonine-protein kinase
VEGSLEIGSWIAGRLELVDVLGEGASGRVYRAYHHHLDKSVAVKVLHSPQRRPQTAARFKAEARAASRIDQVNVVRVLDFGEEGDTLYLTMELLDGETLYHRLRRVGRYDVGPAIELALQILAALVAAHREGIVHRDLKPGNIMLVREIGEDGEVFERVKVCDFGIAKVLDADPGQSLTEANSIIGTPGYMAPEQAMGDGVDTRTDLYACGAVLYELLTGRPPFVGDSVTQILVRVIVEDPPPVSVVAPHVDPRLAAIVSRALARKREDRFQNATEMIVELRGLLGADRLTRAWIPRAPSKGPRSPTPAPSTIVEPPPPRPLAAPPRSKTAGMMIGSGVIGVIGALAFVSLMSEAPPPVVLAPVPDPVVERIEPAPIEKTIEPLPAPMNTPRPPRAVVTRKAPTLITTTRSVEITPAEENRESPPEPLVLQSIEAPPPELKTSLPAADDATAASRIDGTRTLAVTLEDLRVSGGLGAKRCAVALERSLPALRACAMDAIDRRTSQLRAAIAVDAKIGGDGRLRQIRVRGDQLLASCVEAALSSARMPRPDTGDADMSFQLKPM